MHIRASIRSITNVFPVPLAPEIDVISPYPNPPSNAASSSANAPQLARGRWRRRQFSSFSAERRRVEPRDGTAAVSAIVGGLKD